MNTFDFTGKRVLVTGASRGIGLGVARGFAQAGAALSIIATNDTVHESAATLAAVRPPVAILAYVNLPNIL